jgi:hypothetical protein
VSDPTGELLKAVEIAIRESVFASSGTLSWKDNALAAIAAYRAHPDGAAKDWLAGRDAAAEVAAKWQKTDHVLLCAGEMTAQELRTAKAVASAIEGVAGTLQPPTL